MVKKWWLYLNYVSGFFILTFKLHLFFPQIKGIFSIHIQQTINTKPTHVPCSLTLCLHSSMKKPELRCNANGIAHKQNCSANNWLNLKVPLFVHNGKQIASRNTK